MAGYGYKLIRPAMLTPAARLASILGDIIRRTDVWDRAHPQQTIGTSDPLPGDLGSPGSSHLNARDNRLWFATDIGWVSADSQHRFGFVAGDVARSGASYQDTGLQVMYHVPVGGGWVNLFLAGSYWASAGSAEFAVNDGIDRLDTRMLATTGTAPVALSTSPGTSTGTYFGQGGWVTWRASAGDHTLRVTARNTGGTATMRDGRMFVVIF